MSDLGQPTSGREEGKRLYNDGQHADAIPLLQEHIATDPSDISARAHLAASYSQAGRNTEAIEEFTRLTELDPGNPRHYFNLGVVYETMGEPDKAREQFETAFALNPHYQAARQRLAALSQPLQQATPPSHKPIVYEIDAEETGASDLTPPAMAAPPPMPAPEAPEAAAYTEPTEPLAHAYAAPAATGALTAPPPGLNWGAFLLPFWWSIAHKAWLWLVLSIFVYPVAAIYLLIKGNEVACQNRRFASLTEFKAVQKKWTVWGLVIVGVQFLLTALMWGTLAAMLLGGAMSMSDQSDMDPFGAGPTIDMSPAPGQGAAVKVTPYPGALPQGSPTTGNDADGAFTATSYKVAAKFDDVFQYYKGMGNLADEYSASSTGQSADIDMSYKSGKVKVKIGDKGAGQTEFTIKKYAGK